MTLTMTENTVHLHLLENLHKLYRVKEKVLVITFAKLFETGKGTMIKVAKQ